MVEYWNGDGWASTVIAGYNGADVSERYKLNSRVDGQSKTRELRDPKKDKLKPVT